MFSIKKIVTPFLVPPGIFVGLFILAGIRMLWRRRWKGGAGLVILAALMWLAAAPFVARSLGAAWESGLQRPEPPIGDVIIVLGGGADPWAEDMSGPGVPFESTIERIVTAVRLQRRLGLPVIASGGKVYHMPTSEAAIMARLLVDLGVPADRILLETRSRDTAENARYCAEICRSRGLSRPILVTRALHLRRCELAFKAAGLAVTPYPVSLHGNRHRPVHWTDWLPRSYEPLADVIHEALGMLYYRLTVSKSGA